MTHLPKEQQESPDILRCICLDKSDTKLSEDGKRLHAYLKRSESSEITEYSLDGKALRTYAKKNEEIATECLKHQRSRWRSNDPSLEKILLQKLLNQQERKGRDESMRKKRKKAVQRMLPGMPKKRRLRMLIKVCVVLLLPTLYFFL